MNNGKLMVKILGITATVMGIGASLLSDWLNDKKMDEKITEKITEALAKINEKES